MTNLKQFMRHFMLNTRTLMCLLSIALVCSFAQIQAEDQPQDDIDTPIGTDTVNSVDITPLDFPIGLGEKLIFHVSFGLIPAGKATLEVVDTATVDDNLTYHVVTTARSAKAFDYVFKVRDSIETWMDADTIYSHRFHKRLSEGKYRDDQLVVFNQADSLVQWWDRGKKRDPIKVMPRIQDVLTAGFKVRTMPMEVGDTLKVPVHDVNKTYELFVLIRARETVETLSGTYDCFKVEPVLRSGGIFKKEKGAKIFLWLTTDELHIPVLMKSKVSFGSVTADLESYTPGKKIVLGQ